MAFNGRPSAVEEDNPRFQRAGRHMLEELDYERSKLHGADDSNVPCACKVVFWETTVRNVRKPRFSVAEKLIKLPRQVFIRIARQTFAPPLFCDRRMSHSLMRVATANRGAMVTGNIIP